MLTNDRLGLLHWSGAFQSQRCTESISSASQSSWGAVRTPSTCRRMHACVNKHSDVLRQSCATEKVSVYTDFCGDGWTWTETHTKTHIFVYSIYLPTIPQRSVSLIALSRGVNLQVWIVFYSSSFITSNPYIYVICWEPRSTLLEFKPLKSSRADLYILIVLLFMVKS